MMQDAFMSSTSMTLRCGNHHRTLTIQISKDDLFQVTKPIHLNIVKDRKTLNIEKLKLTNV